jgi:hypothetical protein
MEHINTLRGQNAESWYVKVGGTYSYQWALKGYVLEHKSKHIFWSSLAPPGKRILARLVGKSEGKQSTDRKQDM